MIKYLSFFLISFFSIGQNVVIHDNLTKEVIPFVTISDGSKYVYADMNGSVFLNTFKNEDTLTFSALGYQSLEIKKLDVNQVVTLTEVPIQLDAIIMDVKKQKLVQTKKMKREGVLGNQIIPCHYNITSMVLPKSPLFDKRLKAVGLKFKRHSGHSSSQKDRYKEFEIMIRLNVYSRKKDSLGELLYTSKPLNINAGEKDELLFEVNNVVFLEGGFYLQLEHLGSVDSTGSFVDCDGLHLIRPEIADTNSKEYSIISYVQNPVGQVSLNNSLNYEMVGLPNSEKGDYYLNYRFSYYD